MYKLRDGFWFFVDPRIPGIELELCMGYGPALRRATLEPVNTGALRRRLDGVYSGADVMDRELELVPLYSDDIDVLRQTGAIKAIVRAPLYYDYREHCNIKRDLALDKRLCDMMAPVCHTDHKTKVD